MGETIFEQLSDAIAQSLPKNLPDMAQAVYQAMLAEQIDEGEGQALLDSIEARKTAIYVKRESERPQGRVGTFNQIASRRRRAPPTIPRKRQVSPDKKESIRRRRHWAATGSMPAELAARFTLAEQAVMAVIADECRKRGFCDWPMDKIAAVAGVCRRTANYALQKAAMVFRQIEVKRRRLTRFMNLPNIITITGEKWVSWLERRKAKQRQTKQEHSIVCKQMQCTYTKDIKLDRLWESLPLNLVQPPP